MKRAEIVSDLCEGLTDTEAEKFKGLATEIVSEDVDTLKSKLETIRESYFKKSAPVARDLDTEVSTEDAAMISESVLKYASAIKKLNR
jgi:hypothetical protein